MSNARVFCIGATAVLFVLGVLSFLGLGSDDPLRDLQMRALIALPGGLIAVALFGDRTTKSDIDQSVTTHKEGR
jgi:hypothetical protein